MKRILALIAAGILVLSLAACGPKDAETGTPESETTTAPDSSTASGTEPTSTTEEDATTTAPTTNEAPSGGQTTVTPTTVPGQSEAQALKAPTAKGDILALYNAGLTKTSGLSRTAYSREFLTATFADVKIAGIRAGDDINSLETMSKENIMGIDNKRKAHDLLKLTDAQLKSAALKKQEGNLATYELLLQPATADQDMKRGYAGYFGLVTLADIDPLLAEAANGQRYSANIKTYKMSNGKLLVTIDLESGKIQSAEGSFIEDATGSVKISVGTADLILKFDVRATYKV